MQRMFPSMVWFNNNNLSKNMQHMVMLINMNGMLVRCEQSDRAIRVLQVAVPMFGICLVISQ